MRNAKANYAFPVAGNSSELPTCVVAMEACRGSNYWGRKAKELGHTVRLIAPQFVKPFVKTNKNDANDAEAICEAASRPSMRFVPVKSVEQEDLQALHRVRERIVAEQVALVNQIRGLFEEYGYVLPQGVRVIRYRFLTELELAREGLTAMAYELLQQLYFEFKRLDQQVRYYTKKLCAICDQHPVCQRLTTIPGVGPLTATAIIAAAADPQNFKNGRQFAAWIGLVPRQNSSGGKTKLQGISKRGNVYLRKLLVHGARAALRCASGKSDKQSVWVVKLKQHRGANKATVALANKNARIIWTLLARDTQYQPRIAVA